MLPLTCSSSITFKWKSKSTPLDLNSCQCQMKVHQAIVHDNFLKLWDHFSWPQKPISFQLNRWGICRWLQMSVRFENIQVEFFFLFFPSGKSMSPAARISRMPLGRDGFVFYQLRRTGARRRCGPLCFISIIWLPASECITGITFAAEGAVCVWVGWEWKECDSEVETRPRAAHPHAYIGRGEKKDIKQRCGYLSLAY